MADKESALVAIKTELETITITNGYSFDIKKVTRQFETIKNIAVTDFPCLIIEDDGAEELDFKTGGFADIQVDINIIGYVNNRDNVSTKLNELDNALTKAIYSNPTLSGAVGHVSIVEIKERSGSQYNPYGFFVRPIKLFYEVQLPNGL